MKSVRQLFCRSTDDLKREILLLGKSIDDSASVSTRTEVLVFRMSGLERSDSEIISSVCNAGMGQCAFYFNEANGRAILSVPLYGAYEFCARVESQSTDLLFLTNVIKDILSAESLIGPCFKIGRKTYCRTSAPYLMGILNVTPDSFSDGGEFLEPEKAVEKALQMVSEGAAFIDIGGESTRPGAQPVSSDEEVDRVIPVIKAIAAKSDIPVSIDTTKSKVAERALDAGAMIVNDISGMTWDPDMVKVIAKYDAAIVLMHMKGMPRTMQDNPYYEDLISEVHEFLAQQKQTALEGGIDPLRIIVDPGIGFGKKPGDNFELIGRLAEFSTLGPVLLGPSRKSFIGKLLDVPVTERLIGTAASSAIAAYNGVDILRVHDVPEIYQAVKIAWQCKVGSASENEV